MNENDKNAGQPTIGPSGPPVRDLSGETKTVNNYVRPAQKRDALGRWRPRKQVLIRGQEAPGTEHTELLRDSVTGAAFHGRNNAVKFRDPFDGPVHYVSPDYSGHVAPERKSNEHLPDLNSAIDHILGCPACTTGGACR